MNRCLIVPLSAAIIGLVTSTTQLGTPANVLNVSNHLSVSPLSNEAFFSALFLLIAGVYWLASFYEVPSLDILRFWLRATALSRARYGGGHIVRLLHVHHSPLEFSSRAHHTAKNTRS